MSNLVIRELREGEQGNAECPECGHVVLIGRTYGYTLECGKCNVPYVRIPRTRERSMKGGETNGL